MKTRTPGAFAGVVLAAICLAGLSAPYRGDDAVSVIAHILEDRLTGKITRKWYSGKTFLVQWCWAFPSSFPDSLVTARPL